MLYDTPMFFERNRVFRVYQGGSMFDAFFCDDSIDGNYPEEWIASAVQALNQNCTSKKEGVSKIRGTEYYFDEVLEKYPKQMLGEKKKLGVLVKLLDSAVRLPVQAHPDRILSKKYFQSNYGKEECWIILATRENACVYFGFQEGITLEDFKEAIQKGEHDQQAMEKVLVRHEVSVGDVIFIPPKVAHAIGAGCLILEIQEPTDFTIQPERWCGDYRLSDYEMYLGLDKEEALECFDFDSHYDVRQVPILLSKLNGIIYESLVDERQTKNFKVNKVTIDGGNYLLSKGSGIYVIIEGKGKMIGKEYEKLVQKGDYFFMPYHIASQFEIIGEKLIVMECYA
ncbi:mannose-6-phosphate isomerase [Sporanaerobium hydrogeniformans]|uniref:Mannose-6-phosphate isomerase n=1 Tax=Sporanaerobium hydrogeniformans TaxID=3072179 RepID=A0AC61DCI8_9FIRM|nr:class I mannose-6-phosphate isomerase [Sporanaerobium hydrogeniformans]PHV70483.1 mannose-6-phosphate isomerase [Sporanaerobium hydrogeniformans]